MTSESEPIRDNNPAPDTEEKPEKQAKQAKANVPLAPSVPTSPPTKTHCQITCKPEKDFWDKFKTGAEIFGIALLAVYTFYTIKMYCANKQAADAAKSAADTAARQLEIAERPWVSIDTGKLTGFGFQDEMGAYATFDLGVSAMGNTPAQRVKALGRLMTTENYTNPVSQTRTVCDEVEKTALRDVTVFPGQKNTTVRASAIWGKDIAKNSKAKTVNFSVLGCLAYTDSFDKPHHTGFTFDLYKKDPAHPGLEMPIDVVLFGFTGQIDMTPNWSGFITFTD